MVVAKLRDRILISKGARQQFGVEIYDLKKLYDVDVKEKYQTVQIPNCNMVTFVVLFNCVTNLRVP
jgi:hypothetical protein